ncbi:MAG TPA: class I SAM-dependent methyltransferase [Candidatus Binatia bacterium]|nr:class I SAM-dependent methyltransferase [Candidatus Binatia bacterium]
MRPSARAEVFPCPACDGSGPEVFRKRGFAIAECERCATRFVPRGRAPAMRYDEGYFAGDAEGGGYGSYLEDRELVLANFERRVRWFAPLASGRRLLDVGAAYGFLLAAARCHGFEGVGVEPVAGCARFARAELDVDVRTATIEAVDLPAGSFDVATMLDVIEHLDDPRAALRRVHELLRPGGLLVVETGDRDALLARVSGPRWYFYDPPQHVTFFSRRSLVALLARAGFGEPVASAQLGRAVSVRNFAHQLGRALGSGPAGAASRALARSPLGRMRFLVPDRGNAFAVAVRRVGPA